MNPIEQQFFTDLEKKLWTAADKLRSSLDASVYKHVVLGLIFLKYVSDAFEERQNELRAQFQNPEHDYYMDPAEYGGAGTPEYEENIAAELEQNQTIPRKWNLRHYRQCVSNSKTKTIGQTIDHLKMYVHLI